jgi:hypothetical protein
MLALFRAVSRSCAWWGPTACLGLLLVAAVVCLAHHYASAPNPGFTNFNSDDLYPVAVCEDLFQRYDVTGWHLPGAPYVVPDLLLFCPCLVTAGDLGLAFLAYALVFYPLLAALLTALGRQLGLGRRDAAVQGVASVLLLVVTHLGRSPAWWTMSLAHPASHVGILLVGVLLITLALRVLRKGAALLPVAAFVVAGGLGAFSDKLLVVQFLLPLSLTLLLLACGRFITLRRVAALAAGVGGALLLDFALRRLVDHFGMILLPAENALCLAEVRRRGTLFLEEFPACLHGQWVLIGLLPLHLLTAVVVAASWARRLRAPGAPGRDPAQEGVPPLPPGAFGQGGAGGVAPLATALLALFVCFCNVAVVVAAGAWCCPAHSRYLFGVLLTPFLFFGMLVRFLPGCRSRLAGALVPAGIAVFAVWQVVNQAPGFRGGRLHQPCPPLVVVMDQLARDRGLRYGLAEYWSARSVQLLATESVRVKTILLDGAPCLHEDNPNEYLSPDPGDLTVPRYRFIILSRSRSIPDEAALLAEYGAPTERVAVEPGAEVWIYPELHGRRFDRFLDGILAEKRRRRCAFQGPASPARLTRPKKNFTPWDASGNLVIRPGQEAELRFAHPVSGRTIDIAADHLSEYAVTFYRGEERLGALRVPASPWTGAAYMTADSSWLYARLLPLPEPLCGQPWDRVVVRPVGAGRHSVGHFLVSDEPLNGPGRGKGGTTTNGKVP